MINTNREVIPQILVSRPDGSTWEDITTHVSDIDVELGDVSALGTGDSGADSVVRTVSFTVVNDEDSNFAPKDKNSSWNNFDVDDDGRDEYEPLLFPMRQVIVRVGIQSQGETSPTFYDIFAGYIDSADANPSAGVVEVDGRDYAKRMQYSYIEGEYEVASSGSDTAINVIRNIINDNMEDPPTVYDINNLPLGVKKQKIEYKSVWDAVQNFITVSGWFMGYRYNETADEWQLQIIKPPRTKSAVDYAFDATDDIYTQDLSINDNDIRNVCKVVYQDSNGNIQEVVNKDQTSIDKYGRRPMELKFLDEIDKHIEADRLSNYAINDLSELISKTNIDMPIFPQIDLFDTITLDYPEMSSTVDFYAVDSVRHRISISDDTSTLRTEIQATGKVRGGQSKWLRNETRPGAAEPISSSDVRDYNLISSPANIEIRPTANGARMSFDSPITDSISWKYSKVFVSETPNINISDAGTYDFTKQAKATQFNFADEMIMGQTYYLKLVHVGSQDSVSEPSAEYNVVAGNIDRDPNTVPWHNIYWGADYIKLSWQPTFENHFDEYVVRLNDTNFGTIINSNSIITKGKNLNYKFEGFDTNTAPREESYNFYVAGKDKSNNYSIPEQANIQHPGIQKLDFTSQDVKPLLSSIKITLPNVFSETSQLVSSGSTTSEEKEILGYRLFFQEVDPDTGDPIGNEQKIQISVNELGDGVYYFEAETGKSFDIRVGAYDSVYNPIHNLALFEQTKSDPVNVTIFGIQEPDIPDGVIDESKLTTGLSSTISLNESRSTSNGSWIDTNGSDITTTVNEVFPDGTTNTSQIQQLSDEYSVKIQTTSNGTEVVTGFGLNLEGETSEFAVRADRFRIFGDTTAGTTVSSPIFSIDSSENKVYIDSDQITLKSGTNNFFDLDNTGLSISTDDFSMDKNGNAVFSGELSAAKGTFGGELTAATGRLGNSTNYVDFDGNNLYINSSQFTLSDTEATFPGEVDLEGSLKAGETLSPSGNGMIFDQKGLSIINGGYDVVQITTQSPNDLDVGTIGVYDWSGTGERVIMGVDTTLQGGTFEMFNANEYNTVFLDGGTYFQGNYSSGEGYAIGGRLYLRDEMGNTNVKLTARPQSDANYSSSAYFELSGNAQFYGNVDITGTLTGSTKNFKIHHPNKDKQEYYLYHSTVETNTAGDNIYRYSVNVENNQKEIKLPSYFKYLNKDSQVFVNPQNHFGSGYGNIEDNKLLIETDKDGEYNILVIGTRKDEDAEKAWDGAERKYTDIGDLEQAYQRNAEFDLDKEKLEAQKSRGNKNGKGNNGKTK